MTRVLLTGGSGFIAAHVLEHLLKHGHSVVTTVRSQAKADKIKEAHPNAGSNLSFALVEDIAQPGAFDKAVQQDPPLESIIHCASPFHFNAKDIKKDLLDPAVIGTTGILKAAKAHAPTVKRIVITSSFAAIVDGSKGAWPGHTYSEQDWSPLDERSALENQSNGYRASKKLAEKAAWDFVEKEKPNFDLVAMCPPLVFGPIINYFNSLDALNTSNQLVANLVQGKSKGGEIPTGAIFTWIDVRDLALGHVKAMETPQAGNQRFFFTAGFFNNRQVVDVIRKNFPEFNERLPAPDAKGGDFPEGEMYKIDNSKATNVLGMQWTPLEKSISDLVNSLKKLGV